MAQAIRTLYELATKGGGFIRLACRNCDKAAVFSTHELSVWFRQLRYESPWDSFTRRCVCDKCGARGPKAQWLADNPFVVKRGPPLPRPIPDPANTPPGVDPIEWAQARGESERKRLIRKARG